VDPADWGEQPAQEPLDLSVNEDERRSVVDLYLWFARFSPGQKLRIAARQASEARRWQGALRAERRR
jgi:hypothetical protein